MPDRTRRLRALLLHIIILPTLYFAFTFFTLGPKPYTGVDEAVVEKVAGEHGRQAKKPFIDFGAGDLQLFVFLLAGAVGGFAAGYFWRRLTGEKGDRNKEQIKEQNKEQ